MAANFSLTGSLRLSPLWVEPLDASTVTDSTTALVSFALENGTGAGQANAYWRDLRTVAGGATDVIDLAALPLVVFGQIGTLNMATTRAIYIYNRSTSSRLEYVLADSNFSLAPQGVFLWFAKSLANNPPLILDETIQLNIQNPGLVPITYEVVLIGVKAA
jgi:hypothetical protein